MTLIFILLFTLLLASGIIFTLKFDFLQFRPVKLIKTAGSAGGSAFPAFCLSLGGIMGAGNITGVAIALRLGGSGVVFWMCVSALVCSALKYAEVFAAVECKNVRLYDNKYTGIQSADTNDQKIFGPLYYMQRLNKGRGFFCSLFCIMCVLSSFTTGNMVQASAVSEKAGLSQGTFIAAVFFVLLFFMFSTVLKDGSARFSSVAVPVMTALYLLICVAVIAANAKILPEIFCDIIKSAFGLSGTSGIKNAFDIKNAGIRMLYGILSGMLISMRNGFSVGLLSHEAGLGTSPIAHCFTNEKKPHVCASLGILEVYADTLLGAMLTALCILITDSTDVSEAFLGLFGKAGNTLVFVCLFMFSLSSCISWHFYGCAAVSAKSRKYIPVYTFLYCLMMFFAFFVPAQRIYIFSELTNALMAFSNVLPLMIYYSHRENLHKKITLGYKKQFRYKA